MTDSDLINGINSLLEGPMGEAFTYDVGQARSEGKITLCYKATMAPVPIELALTEVAMKAGDLNWRDISRAMKDCLPDNILKQCISDGKTLARGMNRRHFKDVERDIKNWQAKVQRALTTIFGRSHAETFAEKVKVPASIRPNSLQSFHFIIEAGIDRLNNY